MTEEDYKFIGKSYQIQHKGVLTFEDISGLDESGNVLYLMSCTICSKDKELYPELFEITREDFSENIVPCSCSHNPRYTPQQKIIVVERLEALKSSCGGYDRNKSGNFYVVIWEGLGIKLIKIGITNRDPLERISEQASKAVGMEYHVVDVYSHEDGGLIEDLEKEVLVYKRLVVDDNTCKSIKEVFPDGYTEVFPYKEEYIDKIKSFLPTMQNKNN